MIAYCCCNDGSTVLELCTGMPKACLNERFHVAPRHERLESKFESERRSAKKCKDFDERLPAACQDADERPGWGLNSSDGGTPRCMHH